MPKNSLENLPENTSEAFPEQTSEQLPEQISGDIPDKIPDKIQVVEGVAHNGKPCALRDHTGRIPLPELQSLLEDLIANKQFGLTGRSQPGVNTIQLGAPTFTHIQLAGDLYRLVLLPYEANLYEF